MFFFFWNICIFCLMLYFILKQNQHRECFRDDIKSLPFAFYPAANGFFQVGSFLMQWGICMDGGGGDLSTNQKTNPVLFPLPLILYIGPGITLDMIKKRIGWATGVPLPKKFDEIYGAHALAYGNTPTIYENIRVIKTKPQEIIFRTSSYHSPFFWMAYGLSVS